jgi:hypothetical protein
MLLCTAGVAKVGAASARRCAAWGEGTRSLGLFFPWPFLASLCLALALPGPLQTSTRAAARSLPFPFQRGPPAARALTLFRPPRASLTTLP